MSVSKALGAGLGALAFTLIAASAHANLVANGSFESTVNSGKQSFANDVTGWQGGSGLTFLDTPGTADNGSYLSVYGPFPKTSPDGGNFIEADGDPNYSGAFYQSIGGLTVGKAYTLSFFQAAGQQAGFTGPTTEQWKVSFGQQTQLSSLFSLQQGGVGQWQSQTMSFVATSTSQVLTFLAAGTPNGAPPVSFLDGVTLDASPVPEPASLALLGIGAAGLIAARRRKRG